ncbi:protein-export chaperone SecB [Algimonas porphyrae]|uniref:Protein-export protein SecB n=1 Tax=Algimonas porphyrae TaxID=1128113 RepID=A0ABQ5V303_9PROT|nr:protein-export chaperone SecB [Algimonas porphyrae]GLQ20617.1 hypothetical protein GCM10007854_15720 [Algimonas porphyrae]
MAKTPKTPEKSDDDATPATDGTPKSQAATASDLNITLDDGTPGPDAPETTETAATDGTPAQGEPVSEGEPLLRVLAQYTKDMSFENPDAPASLSPNLSRPEISIDLRLGRNVSADNTVEISILMKAHATRDGKTVFIAELDYAGLFAIQNVGMEQIQPLMMIECPRIIFPYARKILADMTQEGGHMPVLIDMPDFASMYRNEMMRRAQEEGLN